ncbi:MAG: hypothetical protein C4527_25775 [Candidatus Omnitrophota bacterium]|nr:MAG: hypothetical protein C4527_25775 [Candidatus Omnitrophota bacterium]
MDIVRAFGVSAISVKQAVKSIGSEGRRRFIPRREPGGASVLIPEVLKQAQVLLSAGVNRAEVAKQLHVKSDTLSKVIRSGRLVEAEKKTKRTEAAKANEAWKTGRRRWGWGAPAWRNGSASLIGKATIRLFSRRCGKNGLRAKPITNIPKTIGRKRNFWRKRWRCQVVSRSA